MKHKTTIELANLADIYLVERGFINPEEIRKVTVTDAVVDTGASGLCLPKSLIEHLGLTPVTSKQALTTNGVVERTVYSTVQFTILERTSTIVAIEVPDGVPVLVGHILLELLDLDLNIKEGLIYNPEHGGEWIIELF